MKRHLILPLLTACCITHSWSQGLLDIGNKWIYEYNTYVWGIGIYSQTIETITVTKDTLINNHLYRQLIATKEDPCGIFSTTEYLREVDGRIYRLSNDYTQEFLIIDFYETTGYELPYETIWTGNGNVEIGQAIVDSFGVEQTPNGTELPIQYLRILNNQTFEDYAQFMVMERVGFIQYGLLFPALSVGLCDVLEGVQLRCHVAGQDTIHFTEFDCTESSIPSSTKDNHVDRALVYPNPTHNSLTLPADYQLIEIRNMQGQAQSFSQHGNRVQLDHLSQGMYLLKLMNSENGKIVAVQILRV